MLITVMGADKSNKNPSRVFRLAGGWHIKPDREPTKTEIVGESEIRYSYSDLRDRLLALARMSQTPEVVLPEVVAQTPEVVAQSFEVVQQARLTESSFDYSQGTPTRYKEITVPVPLGISHFYRIE